MMFYFVTDSFVNDSLDVIIFSLMAYYLEQCDYFIKLNIKYSNLVF